VVSAALTTTSLFSAPSGGVVSSGNANIIQDGNITNINQSSQKASINWQSFSISPQETVNFNQPNQHSITLNRVVGHEKSVIDGALNANGQVWILNSYGVLFGKNAKVNTSGLLATTKELSDADFQKGNYNFKGNSQASIENLGSITINDSSYAAFVANSVVNSGEIKVYGGTIHLVGASEFSVSLDYNSNISLKVDKGTLDALVENNHLLEAHDGRIYLTTNAKDELLKGVVNHSGIIDISSIDELSANQNEVVLYAHGGTTNIDGTIKAKGGFVETSAKDLNITSSSTIQASKWLIDPENVTIDSGNGTIGNESVGANVVSAALDSGTDITIEANNNISVLEDIAWSSGNTFELNAGNDINIHSTIDASGGSGGKVFLVYGNDYSFGLDTDGQGTGFKGKIDLQAGENFSTQKIGEEKVIYTVITDKDTLQNMAINDSTVRYALGRDLDFGSGSNNWTSIYNFKGHFDGLGHTINNLNIDKPTSDYQGLFGKVESSIIKNIGLENVDVSGYDYVGGLVGLNDSGTISNSYTMGDISGNYEVGGLVGATEYGTISNSYATGDVNGVDQVGGLVGYNKAGTIENSYATGDVSGVRNYIGGLVGSSYSIDGTISNSYAIGDVSGDRYIGGLIGYYSNGTISNSYAIGDISGDRYIGGLIGYYSNGTISNSYASGKVSATGSYIGGLVGYYNSGIISNSFYDKETNSSSLMEDILYELDKTREEILNAFSGKDGWITNGSDVEGYSLDTIILPQLITLYKPTSTLFSGGFGTNDNPYTITNWTQLQNINNSNILTSDYYFTLLNNIDKNSDGYMGDSGDGWLPIGDITNKFTGTFDGLNSTIFDLYINRPSENYIGLFGYIDNANIKNLGLEDIEVSGYSHVSGLVGYNYYGTISNSYTTGDVSGNRYIGGLVGYNEGGTIANSYATGNISGTDRYIGGLVGRTYSGTITNSYASGDVSGDYEVGGLVGNNENGTIENSYASGDVSGDEIVGGLVGENYYATILNSYATGNVSGDSYVGGLAGRLDDGTIDNSYTTGDVSGTSGSIGGLIGTNNNGTIDNSYATGDVSGNRYIGGLVGDHSNGTIDNSYATGDVIGTGYSIGGLVGISYYGTIANSYTSGDVNGTGNYIGGLVGYNYNGTITSSYAKGNTNGDNYVGGLVGRAEPNVHIEKSFALGDVNGNYYVGGLIGAFIYSDTTLFDSYALGDVSGKDYVGGLVGYLSYSTLKNSYYGGTLAFVGTGDYRGGIAGNIFNGTIENSYYDKTKNQNLFDEDDYGKSTNELQRFSTFSYWDIVEDPDIAKGYPILAWQENKDKSIWLIHSIPKEEPKEDNHEDIQKLVSTIEQSINSGLTSPQSSFNPIGSAPTPLADDAGGSGSNADDPNFAAPLGGIEYLSVGLAQNVQIINGGIKLPDEPMFLDEDNN